MDRESVILRIQSAFAGVSRKGGVSLHQAQALDDYCSPDEVAVAVLKDTDTEWQHVPDELIARSGAAMCFMDGVGFRYYLPAYMIYSLRNYDISESMSIDHPIYELCPNKEKDKKKFSVFSPDQNMAIKCFLEFMAYDTNEEADSVVAKEALDKYWSNI